MPDIHGKLRELGLELPVMLPGAGGSIVGAVRAGHLVFTSSRAPISEGQVVFIGKLGRDLDEDAGYAAARLAFLHALATIGAVTGGVEHIIRIVKLSGWINCVPDFTGLRAVLNGASDLLTELFGDHAEHARSVVGVASLPHGLAIEIDVIAEVQPDR